MNFLRTVGSGVSGFYKSPAGVFPLLFPRRCLVAYSVDEAEHPHVSGMPSCSNQVALSKYPRCKRILPSVT